MLGRTLVMELDGVVVGDLYLRVSDAWSQVDTADRAGEEAEIGWCLVPRAPGPRLRRPRRPPSWCGSASRTSAYAG